MAANNQNEVLEKKKISFQYNKFLAHLVFLVLVIGFFVGVVWVFYKSSPLINSNQVIFTSRKPDETNLQNNVILFLDFETQPNEDPDQRVISVVKKIFVPNPNAIAYRACYDGILTIDGANTYQYTNNEKNADQKIYTYISSETVMKDKFCPEPENDNPIAPIQYEYIKEDFRATHAVFTYTHPYFFPFDTMRMRTQFWVYVSDFSNSGSVQKISPSIFGSVSSTPEWKITLLSPNSKQDPNQEAVVDIYYERPLIYRILIPVLVIFLFIIIFLSVRIRDLGGYFQVLLGLLFGIWSLKDVILPSFVTGATMLDQIFLTAYLALAASLVYKFILKPYLNSLNGQEGTDNLTNTVIVSKSFQVTIPKIIREALEIKPGHKIQVGIYEQKIILIPKQSTEGDLISESDAGIEKDKE